MHEELFLWGGNMLKNRLLISAAILALLVTNWAFAIDELVVTTRKTEENLQDVPLAITLISEETLQRTGSDKLEDITKFSPSFIFDLGASQKSVLIAVRGLSATRGRSNVAFLVDGIDVTSEAIGTNGAGLLTSTRLLTDVKQVESIKGPQSALYGRAAFAGAINYVTKDAPDEFEASIGGEWAQYDTYSLNGSVGAPITDNFGWLVSGYWFDEGGQYENAFDNGMGGIGTSSLGGGEGAGAALTLNWAPTDTLDFKARFEYIDEEYDDLARARLLNDKVATAANPRPGDTNFVNDGEDFVAYYPTNFGDVSLLKSQDRAFIDGLIAAGGNDHLDDPSITASFPLRRSEDPRSYCIPTGIINPANGQPTFDCDLSRTPSDYAGTSQELFRFSLVANWDVDAIKGTLSSMSGYIDSETSEQYDFDSNALGRPDRQIGTLDIYNDDTVEILSQEFRYRSDFDGPLNIALGAQYWFQERIQNEAGLLGGGPFTPAFAGGSDFWQEDFFPSIESGRNIRDPRTLEDDHKSIYAMLEWDISDQWKATLENRYTDETFTEDRIINVGPPFFGAFRFQPIVQDCTFLNAALAECNTQAYIEETTRCGPGLPKDCFSKAPFANRLIKEVNSKFNTPKLTLEYKPNDDSMYYFSVGKAVKPGGLDVLGGGGKPVTSDAGIDLSTEAGFNEAVTQALDRYIGEKEFNSEKMWAYELGAKNTFEGNFGTVVLNSAAFFQDFTDKQVSIRRFDPTTGLAARTTVNAGAVEVLGLELESTWFTPLDGLTVNASWTWLPIAEYKEFDEVSGSVDTAAKLGNCIPVSEAGDPSSPTPEDCLLSRAGNAVEKAPKNAVVLGANYTRPLGGTNLEWFVEGNALYQSKRNVDSEAATYFKAYKTVDMRLGLESDNWSALLFVDNVLDDDTIKTGTEIPDVSQPLDGVRPNFISIGYLPEKRVAGLRVNYNF
jgi:iron complex outermembrane receptor protein